MKKQAIAAAAAAILAAPALAALYGDPPDARHAWAVHDWNRPKPAKVEVGANGVPSDAKALFDGTKESLDANWCDDSGRPTKWEFRDGVFLRPADRGVGTIRTREEFGDCQLHIEYRHDPALVLKDKGPQMRGNSGVFLMGPRYGYEVQVLESYFTSREAEGTPGYVDNYADGQAGAVYAENPPAVNPARKPGEWQVYDIVFHQPVWKDGKLVHPGSLTVFFNGVLVQDHWEMEGQTTHKRRRPLAPHPAKGPLTLQDHGCEVEYRNIWIREIPSRFANTTCGGPAADEGDVRALRAKTAAGLLAKIDLGNPAAETVNQMLEVMSYSTEEPFRGAAKKLFGEYAAQLEKMDAAALDANKRAILSVMGSYDFLRRHGVLKDCELGKLVNRIAEERGWKRK